MSLGLSLCEGRTTTSLTTRRIRANNRDSYASVTPVVDLNLSHSESAAAYNFTFYSTVSFVVYFSTFVPC